jgi:uncharacterized lipoprotein YddW (UPF0748 family)
MATRTRAIGVRTVRPRLLALTLAVALTVAILPLPSAGAATGSGSCPSHLVPATPFTDTLGSPHRAGIDCALWWGLTHGTSPTRFTPGASITRGQTAAMTARMLRSTGATGAPPPSAGFADTVGHRFEKEIDLLASLGIVSGVTPTHFAPDLPVSRGQMASIIARAFEHGWDAPLPPGPVPFTDVAQESPHRDAIGQLVAAGITSGTTPTTFAPGAPVIRGQMASFLTRAAGVLLKGGQATLPTSRPRADDAYQSRMRGAWVHLFDDTLKTRAGIVKMVDELAVADANIIVAQVARRHDAYYTSSVLPRTPDPKIADGFDVLAELITAAHARGIEVHAWFGVGPTWHDVYKGLPAPSGWIHTTRGMGAPESQRWVSRTYEGATRADVSGWSTYLDPGVPGVQAHVAAVVGELAKNYALDGIHLDYVRYESASHGYNPFALAAYRTATGTTGTPSPTDPAWTAWRREQTRRVILAARSAIQTSGRPVPLSAAVITWGAGPPTPDRAGFQESLPYTRTLQDWDGWVRRGEIDVAMPMNYFRAHDPEHARWFAGWIAYERALAATTDVQVVPGPGGYLNHPSNVMSQVRTAMSVDGAMIYSYQQPTVDGTRGVWSQLASMRWGYAPTR